MRMKMQMLYAFCFNFFCHFINKYMSLADLYCEPLISNANEYLEFIFFFLSFIQTPKKRGRKSTSRSRSRSRGRSASKGRKSPSRKKATPVKQEMAVRRSSRSRSRGRQQTTVETLTVSVTWSLIVGDPSRVSSC